MKTLLFILLSLLGINKLFAQSRIILEGTITNPLTNTVMLNIQKNIVEQPITITLSLDVNNHFLLDYPTDSPVRIDFTHAEADSNQQWYEAPKFYGWLFEPNDTIQLSFDSKSFWQTIRAKGYNSEKVNYYIADFVQSDLQANWRNQIEENYQLTLDKQYNYLDNILEMKQKLFKKYENSITPYFKNFQDNEIKTMVLANKITIINQQREKNTTFNLHSEPAIQNFLKDIIHSNQPFVATKDYISYCNDLLNLKYMNALEEDSKMDYQVFLQKNDPQINEAIMMNEIRAMLVFKRTEVKEKLKEFQTQYPQNPYGKILEKEMTLVFAKLGKAPEFVLENNLGIKKALSDWQGKIIVIDFWASWCKPCLIDMPFTNKIKEHFKANPNIVFLNISIDEDENSWKNAINKYHITGENLLVDKKVIEDYKATVVPTYYVIGKDGNVDNNTIPHPSEENGLSLIKFLEEKLEK
jgi:thiol-disulfide isomerase/thioredoxin